ncbi:MAG TPA: hypothetical protein VN493_23740 [Thermoanaerobaculia bacterium]|nr:hypothetical protein [Thermoanaerobaculia bacterium]
MPRPLLAVLALAAVHMLVFDRGLGGDGWAGFALLESVADDGDIWLEDDHRGIVNGLVPGRDHHLVSQYPPGILVLDAAPFFAGRALGQALPEGEIELPPVGPVPRPVFVSAAAIVLARNLAVLLGLAWTGLALIRLGYPERTAAMAAGIAFFGGPLVFYSLVGMTHAPAFALAALLLWLLVRQRESGSVRLAFAAGAVAGLAVLVRYDAVALLPAALLAVSRLRSRTALLAGFGLPLLVLPFWWSASFGSWGLPSYGGDWSLSPASPWNVLFHPVHGLFLFHPALLFAAAGLVLAWRRPAISAVGAVWFLAVAFLHGGWSEWANTGGYGQRFLIDALPALALGFAEVLGRAGRAVRVGIAAAVLFGYLLFFAATGRLVEPPAPWPWPQRLGDYAPLVSDPPGPSELLDGLLRASFLLRALT